MYLVTLTVAYWLDLLSYGVEATPFFFLYFIEACRQDKAQEFYYCTKFSANEIIALFSITLCPVESL
jgi:hypothetical protein